MKDKLIEIIITFVIILIFIALSYIYLGAVANQKQFKVSFLDVGQGDSILIQTPFRQNILIDGGPDSAVLRRLGEELPWHERTIDLMILTHPHDDHIGGLVYVLKRYKVERIIYTGVLHSSPAFLSWLELVREKNIPLTIVENPQKIILGKNCYLNIFYPKESFLKKETDNLNNSSIVAKLVYSKNSFLLMGDAESEVENLLINSRLESDVLKLGHHGSITSSGETFLEKVSPQYAVIQVGENNDFGHPSKRVVKRLERLGVVFFRNDLDGTITFISDGENIWKL